MVDVADIVDKLVEIFKPFIKEGIFAILGFGAIGFLIEFLPDIIKAKKRNKKKK